MANYINYFNTVEYITVVLEKERTLKAKMAVAKAKAKVGVIHYQWSIGTTYKAKPRSKTILAARGATVDGVYIGDVYIKE